MCVDGDAAARMAHRQCQQSTVKALGRRRKVCSCRRFRHAGRSNKDIGNRALNLWESVWILAVPTIGEAGLRFTPLSLINFAD
jgi:class 3 adenylate cyclase